MCKSFITNSYTCVATLLVHVHCLYLTDTRPGGVLPRHTFGNRTRYPLLLGSQDGDDGAAADGKTPLHRGQSDKIHTQQMHLNI